MKYNSNQQLKTAFVKLLFIFTLITFALSVQAQFSSTITICAGEEVVLNELIQPPHPYPGAPGPNENIPAGCNYIAERTITPTIGLIESFRNSFTLAPLTTTPYLISSRSIPGPPAPDGPPNDHCLTGYWITEEFTIIVEDCSTTACTANNPFAELSWLTDLLNFEDNNGFGYADFIQSYEVNGENYIELFPELNHSLSKIYRCDGSLFCERTDSLSCSLFNESTLSDIFYNTTCTADEANSTDNKIDLELVELTYPSGLGRETNSDFRFKFKNNGPCYLYKTDFVIEVNGENIGVVNWDGSLRQHRTTSVRSNFEYYFEADTEYEVKIWSVNPNGNRDLNLTNDTLKRIYKGFESDFVFYSIQFDSPTPIFSDGMQEVSIEFDNRSNATFKGLINFNWSVNGEMQTPYVSEDIFYDARGGKVVLGNYNFEKGQDYTITAWIELPGLPEEEKIQSTMVYLMPADAVKTDFGISEANYNALTKNVGFKIENKGNVRAETFTINWSVNGISQPSIEVTDVNWLSYTDGLTFDEYTRSVVETDVINENIIYTIDANIELPENYKDVNDQNNSYRFVYENDSISNKEFDRIYTVCEGDSITLLVDEFNYNPGTDGECWSCSVIFDNPEWTFNNRVIDTLTSITIKPVHEGIYTFSTESYQDCRRLCGNYGQPYVIPGSDFTQDEVTVKVIVQECQKKAPNCLNYIGRTYQNSNRIKSSSGHNFLAFDENSEPVEFSSAYIRFDYELIGSMHTPDANPMGNPGFFRQPIKITCLEEIHEDFPIMKSRYEEICIGDQFQETVAMPEGLGTEYDLMICDILKSKPIGNPSIESSVSNDCIFNFEVVNNFSEFSPILEANYENINYRTQVQTINRKEPVSLQWFFSFLFEENCEPTPNPIFNTYSWLTNFANPTVCNGESVYVYDADTYEFLIVKTNLGESIYKTNGELICFSPTGGFSFIGLYNESRILDSWHCEQGFQGRESKPSIQEKGIQIFPNPTEDKVFINLQQLTFEQPAISIYDVQGKQVKQITSAAAFAGIVQMNVNDLERGIYLVEVRTSENILTQKLLIN